MNAFSRGMRKRIFLILYIVVCASGILALVLSFLNPPSDCDVVQRTHTVSRGEVKQTVEGTGAAASANRVSLSGLSGTLSNIAVRNGQAVEEGQLLFELRDPELLAQVESLQGEIADLEQRIPGYEQALAALTMRAKAGGRVAAMSLQAGDALREGDAVCTVYDPENLTCTFRFGSEYFGFFYAGLTIDALDPNGNRAAAVVTAVGDQLYATESGRVHDVTVKIKSSSIFTESIRVQGRYRHDSGVTAYSDNSPMLAFWGITVLTSPADGTVETVYVSNNDIITEGQTVLQLQNDGLTQALTLARSQLEAKKAQLVTAQENARDRQVTSPADGTVEMERSLQAGEEVSPGDVLCVINGTGAAEIVLTMDAGQFSLLTVGLSADIRFAALPETAGAPLSGSVTELSAPETGGTGAGHTATVTFQPPDAPVSGLTGQVTVLIAGEPDVLYVPAEAVTQVWDRSYVFLKVPELSESDRYEGVEARYRPWLEDLVDNTKTQSGELYYCDARPVEVKTGLAGNGRVAVAFGLSEGDVVILPPDSQDTAQSG